MNDLSGRASVKWQFRAGAQRNGEAFDLGVIAGGNLWQRAHSAYRIVLWNKLSYAAAKERGFAFPEDAPRRLRDVDWRKVLTDK